MPAVSPARAREGNTSVPSGRSRCSAVPSEGWTQRTGALDFDQGVLGPTLVETKATDHGPAACQETLSVQSAVTRLGRSSLTVGHRGTRNGVLLLEGYEIKVWATVGDGALRAPQVRAVPSGAG